MAIEGRGGCEVEDCKGTAIAGGHCAGHVPPDERGALSEQLMRQRVLNLQGTRLTAQQLEALVLAARGGLARTRDPLFALLLDYATIEGDVRLALPVRCYASCEGTQFLGSVTLVLHVGCPMSFDGASFAADAMFGGTLCDHASFCGVAFQGDVSMQTLRVGGVLDLTAASFGGAVSLDGLAADAGLIFERTTFQHPLSLSGADLAMRPETTHQQDGRIGAKDDSWWAPLRDLADAPVLELRGDQAALRARHARRPAGVWFRHVTFSAGLDMSQATVGGEEFAFEHARFQDEVDLRGSILASSRVRLGHVHFARRFAAQVTGKALDCRSVDFDGGVNLDVATHALVVEHCWFGRTSLIQRSDQKLSRGDTGLVPRLLSLRGTDAERLRLANLDLSAVRLADVSSLDRMKIEGPLLFAKAPRRRTPRDVLADEWAWRDQHDGWRAPEAAQWGDLVRYVDVEEPPSLTATEISSLYRALRKAREDERDEPGAADFYYGEMEMRRRTRGSPATTILHAYWLTSGYALRPIRAFATLVAVVIAFAAAFYEVGFASPVAPAIGSAVVVSAGKPLPTQPESSERTQASPAPARALALAEDATPLDALVFSAGTATGVLNAPDRDLTRAGDALRVLLRILGPVLAGLTLLAIRGRVKR